MGTKPSKSAKRSKPGAKTRALPAALVKRAEALSRQKLTRVGAAASPGRGKRRPT